MYDYTDYIVIGSGFFGAVIAERIANDMHKKVLVVEKSYHIGGNCYSETDPETGIEYHKYGTHIFHTSNKEVYDYLKQYFEFNSYYHQVLTTHRGKVYQMPINLETINSFFQTNLKPCQVDDFLSQKIKDEITDPPKNFEEFAISKIGKELYEAFIKGYTEKQWGIKPHLLPASIIKRLPIRKNYNESYFFDTWQGIPKNGYTDIFKQMLSHSNITLLLNTDYFDIRNQIPPTAKIIYTGPIDRFFDYCYGKLKWRSLKFEHEILPVEDFQGTSVMNYADIGIPYTRIHEPKHLHTEREAFNTEKTLIIREYPVQDDENPYYPLSDPNSKEMLEKYQAKAAAFSNLIIGGRLGDYNYYDIHHTIEKALSIYTNKIKNGKF
jgi:UDP-galactopyranose mutase